MNAIHKYCSRCLRTRCFYAVADGYTCEFCRKKLYRVTAD